MSSQLMLIRVILMVSAIKNAVAVDLRLSNSPDVHAGRVEVAIYSGFWGTICDDMFGMEEANVICRQLGFSGAVQVFGAARYGEGSGIIYMTETECTGTEQNIMDCQHSTNVHSKCTHQNDAGVECSSKRLPLRITCPPDSEGSTCNSSCVNCVHPPEVQGFLEVLMANKWYSVSGRGWGTADATVVCRELGYRNILDSLPQSKVWPSHRTHPTCINAIVRCSEAGKYRMRLQRTVFNGAACVGNETSLFNCSSRVRGPVRNRYEIGAIVHCSSHIDDESSSILPSETISESSLIQPSLSSLFSMLPSPEVSPQPSPEPVDECHLPVNENYRLRGGPLPWMGRVEVRKNGQWGTICDSRWDHSAANITCHNLGYSGVQYIYIRSYFGRGIGPVHYSSLRCFGNESVLDQCNTDLYGETVEENAKFYCLDHTGDVGVMCVEPPEYCYRQYPGSNVIQDGIVEVNGSSGWGRVCAGNITDSEARVICRESFQTFLKLTTMVEDTSYHGTSYAGSINCTGEEVSLEQCTHHIELGNCSSKFVKIECARDLPDLVPILLSFRESLENRPLVQVRLYSLVCPLEENCLSSSAAQGDLNDLRVLLRFSSLTMNYGKAPFLPHSNDWQWHTCHNHYHSMEDFAHYDILDRNGSKVAEGHKASFCLEDSQCAYGGFIQFRCSGGVQGISQNCGDLYNSNLDCQWVDITDVPIPGEYAIRQHINPLNIVAETNFNNNIIECHVEILNVYTLHVISCSHSDH